MEQAPPSFFFPVPSRAASRPAPKEKNVRCRELASPETKEGQAEAARQKLEVVFLRLRVCSKEQAAVSPRSFPVLPLRKEV